MPDRLRRALLPRYRVERELSGDGESALFLAEDLSLKRLVAVKVLDPEVAGEGLSRRFQREARIIASLTHPNIVSIHDIQSRDGLLYYLRDFLEGQSLSSRLKQGQLPVDEAIRLGRDILSAIGAAHRAGIVHGDLRPETIFCLPGRHVLADFGPANAADTVDLLQSSPDGYRNDLSAIAGIVYQAVTGRVWSGDDGPNWAGVPRRLRAVLQRPWNDAGSFEQALQQSEARSVRGRQLAAAAVGAGLIWGVWSWWPVGRAPQPIPRELAIVPFEEIGGTHDGADLAYLLQLNLDNLPGLSLTSARRVNEWWQRRGQSLTAGGKSQAARELRVHWLARGVLDRQGDSLRTRVTLYDDAGRVTPLPEIRAHHSDLGALSDTLAVALVRSIAPQLAGSYRVVGDLSDVNLPALRQFIRGEAAFGRDAWALAEQHYEAAIALDSSFTLAAWRLANVKHLRRKDSDELRSLYQRPGAKLRPLDALLIDGLSEPYLRSRLSKLELAIERFPEDAYARLLYAEELFHRGPLVGRDLDEGIRAMEAAIARDSLLALAYDHTVMGAIRQGDRERAKATLAQRRRVGSRPSPGDPDVLTLSQFAYDERFAPWRSRFAREALAWRADSAQLDGIAQVFRTGTSWFDIPNTQVALGDLLLRAKGSDAARQGSARVGKALALVTLGRPRQGLAELDSAAILLSSTEASFQRIQWRVALPALGLPLPAERDDWRSRLESFGADSVYGPRAAWTLALAGFASGDTVQARHWWARLRSAGSQARSLERFARAIDLASQRQWAEALAVSDSLDDPVNRTQPGDPFVRAAFHLLRGRWLLSIGDIPGAGREWRWHQNSDVEGWPSGVAQAGEVDGMLGVYARLLRAGLLLRPSATPAERDSGCALIHRVLELWSDVEPSLQPPRGQAEALARSCPA